jgi:hypothetical protein
MNPLSHIRFTSAADDRLLAEVLSLPPARLYRLIDQLVGRPEVAAIGFQIRPKRESPERFPERNAEIRHRHRQGSSYGQLALDFGLTPSGVAKIVQRGRKKFMDNETASINLSNYNSVRRKK